MTTAGSTLFWTVDSPFSRIVLWALCENEDNHVKPVHLSWAELNNNQTIESKLGPERTVPCLTDNSSLPTSDSLRILATFQKATFADWLMSRDGALYRCCEGQWGRVMYALYDGLEPKKVRQLWLIAVEAAEHLVDLTEENPEKIAKVSLGNIALHTF
ncbi:hypothetical protein EBR21_07090, partial [bacterium]|nr:hypothetical protein [bacterium]